MDELLVNVIMPSLISQCSHGMLSKSGILPYIGELLTGFVHVKAFVDHPERPVSWSLAFTVHTILNGVFEVQGPELDFLATTAEDSFNKFMQQVKSTEIQHHDTVLRCPLSIEKEDKEVFDWIQFLVQVPLDMIFKHEWRLLSIWNPYCAGTFLSFLAYLGNLEWGTLFVDSVSQLKVTLHLFNALKQAGAIRPSQIGLLDLIFDIFKDTKAIWEGPIPVKGQFQNRWCTMIGFKCGMTRLMVFAKPSSMNKYTRKTKQLYIDQFSKSFSRICLRHVDGAVDRHEGDEDRRMRRNPLICKLQAHTNSTMKAMSEDDFVLVPNWIRLGFVLNQFYSKLANDFGWVAEMDKVFLDSSRVWKDKDKDVTLSKGIALAFGDRILRPLDDGDAFVASRCTRAMIDFFNGIDPRDVMWYGF